MAAIDKNQQSSIAFYDDLVEECMMEVLFEAHREAKLANAMSLLWYDLQAPGRDVFGQELQSKVSDEKIPCPKCTKIVTAMKFMAHLEGCLGLAGFGRQSARAASRRIYDAANGGSQSSAGRGTSSSPFGDSDSDKEGSTTNDRKRKKKTKKSKNDDEWEPMPTGDMRNSKSPSPAKVSMKLKLPNSKPPRTQGMAPMPARTGTPSYGILPPLEPLASRSASQPMNPVTHHHHNSSLNMQRSSSVSSGISAISLSSASNGSPANPIVLDGLDGQLFKQPHAEVIGTTPSAYDSGYGYDETSPMFPNYTAAGASYYNNFRMPPPYWADRFAARYGACPCPRCSTTNEVVAAASDAQVNDVAGNLAGLSMNGATTAAASASTAGGAGKDKARDSERCSDDEWDDYTFGPPCHGRGGPWGRGGPHHHHPGRGGRGFGHRGFGFPGHHHGHHMPPYGPPPPHHFPHHPAPEFPPYLVEALHRYMAEHMQSQQPPHGRHHHHHGRGGPFHFGHRGGHRHSQSASPSAAADVSGQSEAK
ncbi:hypothetical protein SmJEL517_g01933 [Synchytrium microbalum]|uniref:SAGA-associated factor 11 n=1 Tax=Synchytrium microbalum TaxID=1806994 RepID=A0A507C816_9FUNG|nr:uncharacterized protein SmJEL517_g01933 [Synchytrium microbalum]TPX35752.1 hypothetical protein SmJEL517_g01933 [Synchytrium microbalum]